MKPIKTPVKVTFIVVIVLLVGAVIYNQFMLSKQQEQLRIDVEGIHATLSATPVVTIVPTVEPVSPTASPTAAMRKVAPKVSAEPSK
jgi:hypothetical protein